MARWNLLGIVGVGQHFNQASAEAEAKDKWSQLINKQDLKDAFNYLLYKPIVQCNYYPVVTYIIKYVKKTSVSYSLNLG